MSRESYSELVVEPFTNSIGQVINPGDKVVAVTTGYGHRVNVFTGIFEGVRRRKDEKKRIVGSRVGSIPVKKTGRRYNLVPKITYRKSYLQLNRVFKIDTPAAELPQNLV